MWVHEEEGLYFERGTDINSLGIEECVADVTQSALFHVTPSITGHMCTAVFDVPAVGDVSLSLYDVTGRRVEEVYSGNVGQSRQTVDIPVSHLSNGTYFVLLDTGSTQQIAKFVLIR